jgi:hypothetical protein
MIATEVVLDPALVLVERYAERVRGIKARCSHGKLVGEAAAELDELISINPKVDGKFEH